MNANRNWGSLLLFGVASGLVLSVPWLSDVWLTSQGIVRPWWMRIGPLTLLATTLLAVTCVAMSLVPSFRQRHPGWSLWASRVETVAGLAALTAITVVAARDFIYQPLKYRYLIGRVEEARTVEQERAAFLLAGRWGNVWKLNRVTNRASLPARARHLVGRWVLEVQWLEGPPYAAYRVVLDERNLAPLLHRPP